MRQLIADYLPRASTGPRTAPMLVAYTVSLPAPLPRPNPIALGIPAVDPIMTATVQIATADPLPLEPIPPAAIPPALPPAAISAAQVEPAQGDFDTMTAGSAAWMIQIGAAPTEDGAQDLLERARSAHLGALGPATVRVETFTNDGGTTFYRARFVGFASREAAQAACVQVRSDFDCYVPSR